MFTPKRHLFSEKLKIISSEDCKVKINVCSLKKIPYQVPRESLSLKIEILMHISKNKNVKLKQE